jgi:hypothetical protein
MSVDRLHKSLPPYIFAMCAGVLLLLPGPLTAQEATTGPAGQPAAVPTSTAQNVGGAADVPAEGAIGVSSSNNDAGLNSDDAEPATQQTGPQGLPNAPAAQASAASERAPQTKRILGIVPNFRSVSTDAKLPPQSVKEKFITASEDSFDYSSIVIPALLAGYSLATNATPEFGHGGVGYGRYLWHAAVDQTSENYMVEFVVPSLTHEDTRFYTMSNGSFKRRAVYALTRAVITRSDSGREVFNASEVIGSGASAGLSTLYYPSRERSFGTVGKQWGLDVAIDGAAYFVKEFWPDINHYLFHGAKPTPTATATN